MHMSDALISPAVAAATALVAAAVTAIAVVRLKRNGDNRLVPLMGVMGAFVFAAQMINFAIPGTGSSGHITGGILLAAMLGPWAALVVMMSVIVLQCLIFADGGFLALGCNILNMAVISTVVCYPLVFRPTAGRSPSAWRLTTASVVACAVSAEMGAAAVCIETFASGISVLTLRQFVWFMLPIHLAIGLCDGVATATVLNIVRVRKPQLLEHTRHTAVVRPRRLRLRGALITFAVAALITGGAVAFVASDAPDGLEWSIARTDGIAAVADKADTDIAARIAPIPDYNSTAAGIIGSGAILLVTFAVAGIVGARNRK